LDKRRGMRKKRNGRDKEKPADLFNRLGQHLPFPRHQNILDHSERYALSSLTEGGLAAWFVSLIGPAMPPSFAILSRLILGSLMHQMLSSDVHVVSVPDICHHLLHCIIMYSLVAMRDAQWCTVLCWLQSRTKQKRSKLHCLIEQIRGARVRMNRGGYWWRSDEHRGFLRSWQGCQASLRLTVPFGD
jgi:hypothetical protein